MANPLVSVIIPTYNRAATICAAVESVLRQTYENIEIIVVDDGSTDQTQRVLMEYTDRIHLLHQENAGPSTARNRGIEVVRGEILTFLDSDDLWLPTKIQKQVAILNQVSKSVPCCLCNTIVQSTSKPEQRSFELACMDPKYKEGMWLNVVKVLATRFVLFNQAVAIRREAFNKTGGFDESLWVMEDYDLALRLALMGPWAYIKEPLVIWHRDSNKSLHAQAQNDQIRLHENIEKIYATILRKNSINCSTVRKYLQRNLGISRYELLAAKMFEKGPGWAIGIGRPLKYFNRFRNALFRRSPWYPRMEVLPIEQYS